ncbi:hypothetical protein BD408DRAFT_179269 [Parasitella parasitica]|nr:hypothetical protein BD408DRAFT_179269 [Parasitella parasitica]
MALLFYVVILFLFVSSYSLNIVALILPRWLKFIVLDPQHYSKTTYGLFQQCESSTGECKSFPQENDCKEERFCELWQIAGAGVILAIFIGILIIIALSSIIFIRKDKRVQGWNLITGMLVLHAIPLIVSFSIVIYLSNINSTNFHLGTSYDQSFIMSGISWCSSVILAFFMMAFSSSNNNEYESLL